jgi:Flp pilus assembly protein TadD
MLAAALPTRAQFGSSDIDSDRSSGMRQGRNTLIGKVLYPSGAQIDRRVTVRLTSVAVGEFSTMTDDSGVFTFRRLKEGRYTVTVEGGSGYLPVSAPVDFYDNTGRTETVQIQLRAKPNPVSKAAVIDAGLADVPREAAELYRQGVHSATAGENTKAIEQFKSAVAKYPRFVQALNELSAAYVSLGDLASAGDAIATALKYQPDSPVLRLNYGYVFLLQEKFVDAERELRRAVQVKDTSVSAHLMLGRLLIKVGKFDEAEKELNRAGTLGAGPNVYRYLAELYKQRGENAKAIAALEQYLKLSPNVRDAEQVRSIVKELQAQPEAKKKDEAKPPE